MKNPIGKPLVQSMPLPRPALPTQYRHLRFVDCETGKILNRGGFTLAFRILDLEFNPGSTELHTEWEGAAPAGMLIQYAYSECRHTDNFNRKAGRTRASKRLYGMAPAWSHTFAPDFERPSAEDVITLADGDTLPIVDLRGLEAVVAEELITNFIAEQQQFCLSAAGLDGFDDYLVETKKHGLAIDSEVLLTGTVESAVDALVAQRSADGDKVMLELDTIIDDLEQLASISGNEDLCASIAAAVHRISNIVDAPVDDSDDEGEDDEADELGNGDGEGDAEVDEGELGDDEGDDEGDDDDAGIHKYDVQCDANNNPPEPVVAGDLSARASTLANIHAGLIADHHGLGVLETTARNEAPLVGAAHHKRGETSAIVHIDDLAFQSVQELPRNPQPVNRGALGQLTGYEEFSVGDRSDPRITVVTVSGTTTGRCSSQGLNESATPSSGQDVDVAAKAD